MEVKINKEIREYSENMFFGLTLRQFFFSVLGCIAAVGIYFLCRDALGLELTTWLCVLGVVPFALLGFVTYNGMSAEKVAMAYIKSRIIYPRRYVCRPTSIYYSMLGETLEEKQGKKKRTKRERKVKEID
ncbi:MAG: PrgI family protein [Firmicutes bacterium]|nr:PrgI family protein [Bacillota bacterium]